MIIMIHQKRRYKFHIENMAIFSDRMIALEKFLHSDY